MLITFPDNQNIIARCEILEKLLNRTKREMCARFYHNICIFDAFLSFLCSFSPVCLSSIFPFSHMLSLHWSSSFAQHTCCCLTSEQCTYTYYTIQRLVIVCVSVYLWVCVWMCFFATHCTQCCAYWMHLPRCTLNELWLLMSGGIVEERTKNSMIIHRNWPSPHYYYAWVFFCVLFFFLFLSFAFSFILFIRFSSISFRFSFISYGLPKWQIQLRKN